jgi:hypothetical protein
MDQDNRVLSRLGARELSEQEVQIVSGSFQHRTLTPCFINEKKQLFAGDTSECGDLSL